MSEEANIIRRFLEKKKPSSCNIFGRECRSLEMQAFDKIEAELAAAQARIVELEKTISDMRVYSHETVNGLIKHRDARISELEARNKVMCEEDMFTKGFEAGWIISVEGNNSECSDVGYYEKHLKEALAANGKETE